MKLFAEPWKRWSEALSMPIAEATVVKKRVALRGRGKRGSTRTLVGTNFKDRWFFPYGFEKNERDNIEDKELSALQATAKNLLALKDVQIKTAIADGALLEIRHGKQT
jgi:hypothetical protein